MTKENISNIHDKFFHKMLKDERNAEDFLKLALPDDISGELDYSQIKFDDTSYVQDRFKSFFSDIVIKTRIKDHPSDIYILIEHKSAPEEKHRIFLQLLNYIYSVFEQDFNNNVSFRNIIPLVFYHGKEDWNIPRNFSTLYNCPDRIKKYLLDFCYILYNTQSFDENNSQKIAENNIVLISSLIALKTAFDKDRDNLKLIRKILETLYEAGIFDDKAVVIVEYIIQTKNIKEEDIKELINEKIGGEIMTTVLDKYLEKGKEEGILLEKQLVLIKLLSRKFHISDDIKDFIKQIKDPVKLDTALEEILFAESPEDVLSCLK